VKKKPVEQSSKYVELAEMAKMKLSRDFAKLGITLSRINIDAPKVLDKTISNKMAQFSVTTTEVRAKEQALERRFKIVHQEALQAAVKLQIAQEQDNANRISIAKAELESSKHETKSKVVKATGEAKIRDTMLEVDLKKAKMYEQHPGLLSLDIFSMNQEAINSVPLMIISPENANVLYTFDSYTPDYVQDLLENPGLDKKNYLDNNSIPIEKKEKNGKKTKNRREN